MASPFATLARRFVLVAGDIPIADGCTFPGGLTVLASRTSPGLTVYPEGVSSIPGAATVQYVDAEREWRTHP